MRREILGESDEDEEGGEGRGHGGEGVDGDGMHTVITDMTEQDLVRRPEVVLARLLLRETACPIRSICGGRST